MLLIRSLLSFSLQLFVNCVLEGYLERFSFIPGDMVDESVMFLMFLVWTAASAASMFSESFLSPKEILPTVR